MNKTLHTYALVFLLMMPMWIFSVKNDYTLFRNGPHDEEIARYHSIVNGIDYTLSDIMYGYKNGRIVKEQVNDQINSLARDLSGILNLKEDWIRGEQKLALGCFITIMKTLDKKNLLTDDTVTNFNRLIERIKNEAPDSYKVLEPIAAQGFLFLAERSFAKERPTPEAITYLKKIFTNPEQLPTHLDAKIIEPARKLELAIAEKYLRPVGIYDTDEKNEAENLLINIIQPNSGAQITTVKKAYQSLFERYYTIIEQHHESEASLKKAKEFLHKIIDDTYYSTRDIKQNAYKYQVLLANYYNLSLGMQDEARTLAEEVLESPIATPQVKADARTILKEI